MVINVPGQNGYVIDQMVLFLNQGIDQTSSDQAVPAENYGYTIEMQLTLLLQITDVLAQ